MADFVDPFAQQAAPQQAATGDFVDPFANGTSVANQIPTPPPVGPPVSNEQWNPLTMANAKQGVADLIRGATSTWNLGGDLGVRAGNAIFNQQRPLPSAEQEQWLRKTFGEPDTSPAGQAGNFAGTLLGGMLDPAAATGQIGRAQLWQRGATNAMASPAQAAVGAGNAVTNDIFSAAQDLGMKLPPNYVGAGAGSRTLGFFGGNDALTQQMNARNLGVFDATSRQVAGLGPAANLTDSVLTNKAKDVATATYEPLKQLGTIYNQPAYFQDLRAAVKPYLDAEATFSGSGDKRIADLYSQYATLKFNTKGVTTTLSNLRNDADQAYKAGDFGLASARRGVAQAIENSIQANLQNPFSSVSKNLTAQGNNSAQMLNDYLAGRRDLAQTYAVRDALTGTGHVDPQKFADNMNPAWTGDLKTMGQFANAAPQLSQFSTVPSKTFLGATKSELGTMGSVVPTALLHPAALPAVGTMAAIMAARAGTRQALMSKLYQQLLVHPNAGIMAQPGVQNTVPAFIQNSGLFGPQPLQ